MHGIIWNARGIRRKKAELIEKIKDYDIICIAETKLNNKINMQFTRYTTYRSDRKKMKISSGGAAILVKKEIKHKPVDICKRSRDVLLHQQPDNKYK